MPPLVREIEENGQPTASLREQSRYLTLRDYPDDRIETRAFIAAISVRFIASSANPFVQLLGDSQVQRDAACASEYVRRLKEVHSECTSPATGIPPHFAEIHKAFGNAIEALRQAADGALEVGYVKTDKALAAALDAVRPTADYARVLKHTQSEGDLTDLNRSFLDPKV